MKPINILLIEDNADDEYMVKRAFKKARILNDITVIRDGQEALSYLFREGQFADGIYTLPELIILDLNLPKVSGKEVLEKVSKETDLKEIPVIILTVSNSTEDILDCYDRGIYAYLTKPLSHENILDFVIEENFFGIYLVKNPDQKEHL